MACVCVRGVCDVRGLGGTPTLTRQRPAASEALASTSKLPPRLAQMGGGSPPSATPAAEVTGRLSATTPTSELGDLVNQIGAWATATLEPGGTPAPVAEDLAEAEDETASIS